MQKFKLFILSILMLISNLTFAEGFQLDRSNVVVDNPRTYGIPYSYILPRSAKTAKIEVVDINLNDITISGNGQKVQSNVETSNGNYIDGKFGTNVDVVNIDHTTSIDIATSRVTTDKENGRAVGVKISLSNFVLNPSIHSHRIPRVIFGNSESWKTEFIESVDVSYRFYYLDDGSDAPLYAWGVPRGYMNQLNTSKDNEAIIPRNYNDIFIDEGLESAFGRVTLENGTSNYEAFYAKRVGGTGSVFWTTDGNSVDFTMINVGANDDGSPGYDLTFWLTWGWVPEWNLVPENPTKTYADGKNSGDAVENGQAIAYSINQKFGELNVDMTKPYEGFVMIDKLPLEVDFQSVALMVNGKDVTQEVVGSVTGAFNDVTREVRLPFKQEFLNNLANYKGQTFNMIVNTVINEKIADTHKVINQGYTLFNGYRLDTNIVENPEGVPSYNIKTKITNGEITESIKRIPKGENRDVTYSCSADHYLASLTINGEETIKSADNYEKEGILFDKSGEYSKGATIQFNSINRNHEVVAICNPIEDDFDKMFYGDAQYEFVEEGQVIKYDLKKGIPLLENLPAKYSSLVLGDQLPQELIYVGGKMVNHRGEDVTTTEGILNYDKDKHLVTFTFKEELLQNDAFYVGADYHLEIETKVKGNLGDVVIENLGFTEFNKNTKVKDGVITKVGVYKILTDGVNTKISNDEYGIKHNEDRTITFKPNDGYYLKQICVNDAKAVFEECIDITKDFVKKFTSLTQEFTYDFSKITSNKAIRVVSEKLPNIVITKTSDKNSYLVGEYVNYEVVIKQTTNNASELNVQVSDVIDKELLEMDANSIVTNHKAVYGSDLTVTTTDTGYSFTIPELEFGKDIIITYRAKALKPSNNAVNTVTAQGTLIPTPKTKENSVEIHEVINPELVINKINNRPTVNHDDEIQYTITVKQIKEGAVSKDVLIIDTGADKNIETIHSTIKVMGADNATITNKGNGFEVRIPELPYNTPVIITYNGKARNEVPNTFIESINTASVQEGNGIPKISKSKTTIYRPINEENIPSPVKKIEYEGKYYDILANTVLKQKFNYEISQKFHEMNVNIKDKYSALKFSDTIPEEITILGFKVLDDKGVDITSTAGKATIEGQNITYDFNKEYLDALELTGQTYKFIVNGQVNIKAFMTGDKLELKASKNQSEVFAVTSNPLVKNFTSKSNIVTSVPVIYENPENPTKAIVVDSKEYELYENVEVGKEVTFAIKQKVHTLGKNIMTKYENFEIFDKLTEDVEYVSAKLVDDKGSEVKGDIKYDSSTHTVRYIFDKTYLANMKMEGEVYTLLINVKIREKAKDTILNTGDSIIEIHLEDNGVKKVFRKHELRTNEVKLTKFTPKVVEVPKQPTPTPSPTPRVKTGVSGTSIALGLASLLFGSGVIYLIFQKKNKER